MEQKINKLINTGGSRKAVIGGGCGSREKDGAIAGKGGRSDAKGRVSTHDTTNASSDGSTDAVIDAGNGSRRGSYLSATDTIVDLLEDKL